MGIARVAIFEDNDNLRSSLSFMLENTPGLSCTGAFPDCSDLAVKLEISRPDVILMDIDMPGISGIEAVKEVKKLAPQANTIMHTVFDDESRILQAICNGAVGYLLKGAHAQKIISAVEEAREGGSPMSPGIARKVTMLLSAKGQSSGTELKINLTNREMEVLQELANGKSYKMIADYLQMAVPTVNTHIRKIYEKLQVNSLQEAVAKAIRAGIV
jgi:DNA-binding NarL/FixJ family response regulator